MQVHVHFARRHRAVIAAVWVVNVTKFSQLIVLKDTRVKKFILIELLQHTFRGPIGVPRFNLRDRISLQVSQQMCHHNAHSVIVPGIFFHRVIRRRHCVPDVLGYHLNIRSKLLVVLLSSLLMRGWARYIQLSTREDVDWLVLQVL